MPKHRNREHHFDQDLTYNYLELLTAVFKLAVIDARRGDEDALGFIRDTVPALDRDGILTIKHRPPRRRVPKYIQMN